MGECRYIFRPRAFCSALDLGAARTSGFENARIADLDVPVHDAIVELLRGEDHEERTQAAGEHVVFECVVFSMSAVGVLVSDVFGNLDGHGAFDTDLHGQSPCCSVETNIYIFLKK